MSVGSGAHRTAYLDLFGNDLSDASMSILNRMTNLTELTLGGRRFTDAGLSELAGMTRLRRLLLSDTGVTTNGVAALRARLPQAHIEAWSPEDHD